MDPFAERDAFVNQINQQRMQNQIAFNSGGPTNPAAGMNPGIDYQLAMQQAGLAGGAPSMSPEYGDSLIARLNSQFGGQRNPSQFGGQGNPFANQTQAAPFQSPFSSPSAPQQPAFYPGGTMNDGYGMGAPPSQGAPQRRGRSVNEIAGDFYDPNPGGIRAMVVQNWHNPQTGEEYGGTGIVPRPGTGWVQGKSPVARLREELDQAERNAASPPRGWDEATRTVVEGPPGAAEQYAQQAEGLRRQIAEMEAQGSPQRPQGTAGYEYGNYGLPGQAIPIAPPSQGTPYRATVEDRYGMLPGGAPTPNPKGTGRGNWPIRPDGGLASPSEVDPALRRRLNDPAFWNARPYAGDPRSKPPASPRPSAPNRRDVQAAFENPSAWQYQDPQEAGRLAREAGKDSRQAYNAANKNNWLGPDARRSVGNMSSDNQKAYLLMGGFNQNEANDYMKRNSGKGKKKR
jgi:hypothetical protein